MVDACALREDFQIFIAGDETEVLVGDYLFITWKSCMHLYSF